MVTRIGGFRRKTRHKLSKRRNEKGKFSLRDFFQKFETGQQVVFKAEPAYQNGMYHPRFHGKVGVVKTMQGKCYQVAIKDGSIPKILVVHPIHLRKVVVNPIHLRKV